MNSKKIKNIIEEIKTKIAQVEIYLEQEQQQEQQEQEQEIDSDYEFKCLKNLLESQEWPEAVFSFQICNQNSEEDKMNRAESVIDILVADSLKEKKFLDFGCGEGHMAKYASTQETKISVGYDIKKPENSNFSWGEKKDNFLLSTDLDQVKENGPYDVILIYDVIDHCFDQVSILKEAKSLLSEGGVIYLRCHPWCGRHGGHLYRQINKAFCHVLFSEKELSELGFDFEHTNRTLFPILEYNKIIEESGLNKNEPDIETQDVEEFFKNNNIIYNRILKVFEKDEFPEWQLSQCFLDYKLTKGDM